MASSFDRAWLFDSSHLLACDFHSWRAPRKLVEIGQGVLADLLGAAWGVENECSIVGGNAGLPVPYHQGILRRPTHSLAGDDQLAGSRRRACFHPKLPVHILLAKEKVLALGPANDAFTDMLGADYVADYRVVDVAEQDVGARQW